MGRLKGQFCKIRSFIWVGSSLPKPYRKCAYWEGGIRLSIAIFHNRDLRPQPPNANPSKPSIDYQSNFPTKLSAIKCFTIKWLQLFCYETTICRVSIRHGPRGKYDFKFWRGFSILWREVHLHDLRKYHAANSSHRRSVS